MARASDSSGGASNAAPAIAATPSPDGLRLCDDGRIFFSASARVQDDGPARRSIRHTGLPVLRQYRCRSNRARPRLPMRTMRRALCSRPWRCLTAGRSVRSRGASRLHSRSWRWLCRVRSAARRGDRGHGRLQPVSREIAGTRRSRISVMVLRRGGPVRRSRRSVQSPCSRSSDGPPRRRRMGRASGRASRGSGLRLPARGLGARDRQAILRSITSIVTRSGHRAAVSIAVSPLIKREHTVMRDE